MTTEEKKEAWIPNGLRHLEWQFAKADETYYDGQVLLVWEKIRNLQNGCEWCEIFTIHITVCEDGEACPEDQSGNWGGDLREGLVYVDISDPPPEFAASPNVEAAKRCLEAITKVDHSLDRDTHGDLDYCDGWNDCLREQSCLIEKALATLNGEKR